MIRINQMKLNIEHTSDDFERKILKTLCIKKEELQGFQIRKQSIDARKKPVLYYVYSVDVQVRDEAKVKKTVKNNQIQFQVKPDSYHFEVKGTKELTHRPVIIGTGPAGLSAALNLKTYKKIIKGFDYLDIGAIHMKDSAGNAVASIGEKSDLIWEVFYGYFVNENGDGSIDHVYSNHEKYLSIQLFNVEALSQEEIVARVNEILLHVSMVYDMDFKVFEVDSLIKCEGETPILRVEYTPTGFEEVPMFYLLNANNTNDERFKFLSYYQVIEYFFVRAQNYYFLEELKSIDMNNVNHNELRKILANYKKVTNERETLKLVLKRAIDIPKFKTWINSNSEHFDIYCRSQGYKIDLSKEDKKIISNIVERVYGYRCSIAHAKGDVEEYIAIPNISRKIIAAEIPLVKYLAYEVIKNCSEK